MPPPPTVGKEQGALLFTSYQSKTDSAFQRKGPCMTLEYNFLVLCNNDPKTFPCQNLKYGNSVISISPKAAVCPPPFFLPIHPSLFARGSGWKPPADTPGVCTPLFCSKSRSSLACREPTSPQRAYLPDFNEEDKKKN